MSDFLLGFVSCIGILFYAWSLFYAIAFFVYRDIKFSIGTLVIVLIPLLNSILAIIYFNKGGERL